MREYITHAFFLTANTLSLFCSFLLSFILSQYPSITLNSYIFLTAFCGRGTFSATGLATCNVCPIGSYQPLTGRTYCHTCQMGLTTWTEGSFALEHCTGMQSLANVRDGPKSVTITTSLCSE